MVDANLRHVARLLYLFRNQARRKLPQQSSNYTSNYLTNASQGGAGFSASNFFQYMIGVLVIFGFTAGYKVIFRTPWRDPATADCLTGRRHLSVEEIKHLDEYYAKPKWRRFLTYVQLW